MFNRIQILLQMKYFLFVIVGMLVTNNCAAQNNIKVIDSILHRLYWADKLNGNILIAEKGQVVYNKSFGLANEITRQQLNDCSVFELASLTKQFTAMAIMILKEQKKLNLDESIARYLPELSFYHAITIRNLLNHTGGLPDYLKLMEHTWNKTRIATNQDVIDFFSKNQPKPLFEANTRFDYSNTGYVFLASIIERCAGMPYPVFLKRNIFNPLDMLQTEVFRRRYAPHKVVNYAWGYEYVEKQKRYQLPDSLPQSQYVVWMDGVYGDGAVHSTVVDLLK